MSKGKQSESHQHRNRIGGIPHCPGCGGMLWPPDYTGPVIDEDGEELDSVLDGDPKSAFYHTECYDAETNDTEPHHPHVPSENSAAVLETDDLKPIKRQSSSE